MDYLVHQQWLIVAVIFFGIIFYISWRRWQDRKWIRERFGEQPPVALSFGVHFFGRATEPVSPRRKTGFLLLLPDRLVFRGRGNRPVLDIPGRRIARVYHGTSHKGVELHQSVIKVDFLADGEELDTAAFKVPYPPQWIQAIGSTLIVPPDPQTLQRQVSK